MPRLAWIVLSAGLAGCAAPAPTQTHAPLASKACSAVAQARMNDAAANNYDAAMQEAVFRGSYEECVRWQDKASMVTSARR